MKTFLTMFALLTSVSSFASSRYFILSVSVEDEKYESLIKIENDVCSNIEKDFYGHVVTKAPCKLTESDFKIGQMTSAESCNKALKEVQQMQLPQGSQEFRVRKLPNSTFALLDPGAESENIEDQNVSVKLKEVGKLKFTAKSLITGCKI